MKRPIPLFLCLCLSGCNGFFLGTPKQELMKRGAVITIIDEDRSIRIDLHQKKVSGGDLSIALALCSNHSREYSSLRELDLSRSGVGDDGLDVMTMNSDWLSDLEVLDLRETAVSDEAVAELQAEIPNCRIVR